MLKDYFEVPNKPAIKSGNVLSCDFTDHETFIPQPLDFTRNTSATYVDCNGIIAEAGIDIPRIDYLTEIDKAKELQKPSLLLEPQATNNYTYSNDFTQTYWLKQNGVTVSSNQTKSPEDVVNADKLISANATSEQYLNNTSISTTSGDDVTISCFVKKLDYDYFHIRFTATGGVWVAASVWYNISDGTVGTVEAGITAKIENYGNGWYRCSATRTATGTGSGRVRLQLASSDNTANVVGDGTKGTFIYGAQWEVGSYPTSYIPTSGSTVTRNVELCDNAGQRGVFNNEEGTMYVEFTELGFTNPNQTSIGVSQDSSSNNRLLLFRGGGANWAFQVRAASVNVVSNTIFTMTSPTTETLNNKFVKVAIRYKSGEITAFVNGSQTFTNSSTFTFNGELDKFGFIPYDGSTGNNFYGRVKDIKVFRRTLTDSEMAELTNNIT